MKKKSSDTSPKIDDDFEVSEKVWDAFEWMTLTPSPVIGVDEVGRGCLAGAVYAAAVIINDGKDLEHFTDSKLISEDRREELSEIIFRDHKVCIGIATVAEIHRLNIFHASLLAMRRAVAGLKVDYGHILVDGKFRIPRMSKAFQQTPLIKGDLRAKPISAASIVAKVARDREMKRLGEKYPDYGFHSHKGYSTQVHMDAIKKHGVLPIHRKAFAGVKEYL